MPEEIIKSVKAALYERASSPFYGTFVLSWAIFNWKAIYASIFVSGSEIEGTKLDYILKMYEMPALELNFQVWANPLISTVLLLTIGQAVAYGAHWITYWFKNQKNNSRFEIDKSKTVSTNDYIELQRNFKELQEKYHVILNTSQSDFQKQVEQKDLSITELEKDVKNLNIENVKNLTEIGELKNKLNPLIGADLDKTIIELNKEKHNCQIISTNLKEEEEKLVKLKAKFEDLEKKRKEDKKKSSDQQMEIKNLSAKNTKLEENNKALSLGFSNIKNENRELKKSNEELNEEKIKLKNRFDKEIDDLNFKIKLTEENNLENRETREIEIRRLKMEVKRFRLNNIIRKRKGKSGNSIKSQPAFVDLNDGSGFQENAIITSNFKDNNASFHRLIKFFEQIAQDKYFCNILEIIENENTLDLLVTENLNDSELDEIRNAWKVNDGKQTEINTKKFNIDDTINWFTTD